MPHANHLPIRPHWANHGTSPFAQPVAAITAFVQSLPTRARAMFVTWSTHRRDCLSGGMLSPADWESRQQEARFAEATDPGMLEGLQRAVDRRDGAGLSGWESR